MTFYLVQLHFILVSTPTADSDLLIRGGVHRARMMTRCACMNTHCACMLMHCTRMSMKYASIPMHNFLSGSVALYPGGDCECSLRFVDPWRCALLMHDYALRVHGYARRMDVDALHVHVC